MTKTCYWCGLGEEIGEITNWAICNDGDRSRTPELNESIPYDQHITCMDEVEKYFGYDPYFQTANYGYFMETILWELDEDIALQLKSRIEEEMLVYIQGNKSIYNNPKFNPKKRIDNHA